MGFCVKCGKKGIEGSLCSECFKEENPVLKEFKEMRIEVCRNCKAFRNHGRWYDTDSLKDAVKKVALESVKKAGTNVKPVITTLFDENINREKKKDIEIEVKYDGEMYMLPCRLIFQDCPRCSKKKSAYFEAVLQLRNPRPEIIKFIEDRIESKKAKGIFLTDKKKEGDGLDFYLTNKTYAVHLGRLLQDNFFGILKISVRLFTG